MRKLAALAVAASAVPAAMAAAALAIGSDAPPVVLAGKAFAGHEVGAVARGQLSVEGAKTLADIVPTPETLALARQAVQAEPVNPAAFFTLLLGFRGEEQRLAREQFIERALSVRPRTPSLLAAQMESAGAKGNIGALLGSLDRLTLLRRERVRGLMPTITQILFANGTNEEIVEILSQEPAWSKMFVAQAVRQEELLPRLGAIVAALPDSDISNDELDSALISRLVAAGEARTAYEIYSTRTRDRAADGIFADASTQYAPFDWRLVENATQTASLGDNGALRIDMLTGGGRAATRLLSLDAGSWRLTGDVARDGDGRQTVRMTVGCFGTQTQLASRELSVGDDKLALDFDIPRTGCDFQQLTVTSERAAISSPTVVEFTGLELARPR